MNNIIANIRTQLQKLKCRIANLSSRVTYIEDNCCNGGGDIPDVSATERGIVNNEPLQELGGVDKLINGIRVGRGSANEEGTTVFGKDALASNTTGEENTAIGISSLVENTTGSTNTGIGAWTLYNNISGDWNFAAGHSSLWQNTTGSRNVAIGTALDSNTTGAFNSAIGVSAGYSNVTGSFNTYIGNISGYNNGIGGYNVALGFSALITTGGGAATPTVNQNRNVFIGSRIIGSNTQSDTFAVDNKGTTYTNAENALLYGGFSNANRFLRINGRFEIAPSTMPIADATYTKKLVWNPTTGVVAETDDTGGEQQFVQITEGANTGWGLKYRADNPNYYGSIGSNAIDLGYSNTNSTTIGATGSRSTVSGGNNNTASSQYSTVSGGYTNTASGSRSTVSGGNNNTASGSYSTVSGGLSNITSGDASTVSGGGYNIASSQYSTVSGGSNNTANSYGEWVGGIYGTTPTGQNATSWVATDRLFNIGNGTNPSLRSNAFTILKNGLATLPSVTNALIDAEPTGKAVVTREWFEANSGGSTPTLSEVLAEGNVADTGIEFENSDGTTVNIFNEEGRDYGKIFIYDIGSLLETEIGGDFITFKQPVGNITLNGNNNFLEIYSDIPSFKGLESATYYGANYTDNTYVQKKYVDDANSYSTDETLTGGTWIDGKPIYRRVIKGTFNSSVSYFLPFTGIADMDSARVIKVDGWLQNEEDYMFPFNVPAEKHTATTDKIGVYWVQEYIANGFTMYVEKADTFVTDKNIPYTIIAEYYKITD